MTLYKYYDTTNSEFGTSGGSTITLGPFESDDFSGSQTVLVPAVSPFAITDVVVINHNGSGLTSFDATNIVKPIPEPGTLILLGCGLVGVAGYTKLRLSRRKK